MLCLYFSPKKFSPPLLLLYTLKRCLVQVTSEFLNLGTSDILNQYSFIMGGYLAESLASLLWMPVAFPLPLHQSCDSQKCSRGSKSPLFENRWAASMYSFAFQLLCVLANGSTRKIKWGGRKVSSGHCSPNYLRPARSVQAGCYSKDHSCQAARFTQPLPFHLLAHFLSPTSPPHPALNLPLLL